jgi:hypothetical protein
VIDPSSNTDRVADALIVNGRVAGVTFSLSSLKTEVFDATGTIAGKPSSQLAAAPAPSTAGRSTAGRWRPW